MIKKIIACAAAVCAVITLAACGSKQALAETEAAATATRSRETTTAAATTAATTSAAEMPQETTEETEEFYVDDAMLEAATDLGIWLNDDYDLYGNGNWGYIVFYDDGFFEYSNNEDEVYEEGSWTVTDGNMIVNLPDYGEMPVVILNGGDAVMIGEGDAIIGILADANPPLETDRALISDDRGTYMDVIGFSNDVPGTMYWIDVDEDGNTLSEGSGTYKYIDFEGKTFAIFAPDDYTNEMPIIAEIIDGEVYTDGSYTWTIGAGENAGNE
jgi:hypothetical protein